MALREKRKLELPKISYPPDLPITARKDDIVNAIRANQVVVIAGETGSGKTTQIPKMCLEAGLGIEAKIGCTQPRRVAARGKRPVLRLGRVIAALRLPNRGRRSAAGSLPSHSERMLRNRPRLLRRRSREAAKYWTEGADVRVRRLECQLGSRVAAL